MKERSYSSPLREAQARQTRGAILDALTELLSDRSADEISTREIAVAAGVSQPTVYRYFPDRQALLEGLADRVNLLAAPHSRAPETLDELVRMASDWVMLAETHAVEATAEAVLNADPRRFSRATRRRSDDIQRLVAAAFPEHSERDHVRITALMRVLISTQTWLRMREEFGVRGGESGPLVTWALETLVREIRAGNFPRD